MNRTALLAACLLGAVLLAGCSSSAATQPPVPPSETTAPTPTENPATPEATAAPVCTSMAAAGNQEGDLFWWNDTVFYQIFVRSFYDSDGDGIGDLNGIIQKLDYLNDGDDSTTEELGVSGIWLMPIHPSPSYHGYDVADYLDVNPEYGTLDDLRDLLDEAHRRGMRVIIDMVLNHTSTRHPWFIEASSDPESEYRDYYIFTDSPGGFQSPWGTEVWFKLDTGFYYALNSAGMPDLDYTNTLVVEEMQEVVRFWLEDVGVDGFRLDAVKHIIEEGAVQENTASTHDFWKDFYDYYTGINPEALTVGEAWTSTSEVVRYIGDEVNIAFEFSLAGAMLDSARTGRNMSIRQAHELVTGSYPAHQYASFLSNHDQPRTISVLLGDVGKAKSAASLLLTGPGVPFLYYGEEVGQRGNKPDENLRAPMQWSAEANAGFSEAAQPWRLPQRGYEEANVALETGDPDSLLSHYRRLIHARNANPALRSGALLPLPGETAGVYGFLRFSQGQTLLVVVNLSPNPTQNYTFCLSEGPLAEGTAIEILQGATVNAPTLNASGGFDNYRPVDSLEAYTTYIIELK